MRGKIRLPEGMGSVFQVMEMFYISVCTVAKEVCMFIKLIEQST